MSTPPPRAIGELVEPVSSWAPERDDPEGVFTYIDLSAVDQDAKIVSGARELTCSEAPSRARQLVRAGDVLVSTVRPNLNGVARVPPECDGATASTGFCVLRPRADRLDGQYLYQWVKSPRFVSDMTRKATGASYPAVSDRIVCESKLPLPPLPEQRRIAEILDKADALRSKRRAALAQLDTLTQSIFLDMFGDPATNPKGWPVSRIGSIAKQIRGVTYSKGEAADEPLASYLPILRAGNISAGQIVLDDLVFVPETRVAENQRLQKDDILIAASSGSMEIVGKAARVQQDLAAGFGAFCKVLRPGSDVDPNFFAVFFGTQYYRRRVSALAAGININNLKNEHLDDFPLPLPPLGLQNAFSAKAAALEACKEYCRSSLNEFDALFASLQHRAFRGEL